jgi:hypothetical protein
MSNVIPMKNDQNSSMTNYIEILKEAQEILFSDDKTISVKDLTLCPRKKIYSIIDRLPMTNQQLSNITIGKIAEYVIKKYFMLFNRFDFDLEIQYKNVKGFVDIYDKLAHTIIEIKISRIGNITKPNKWDEEQIKNYMAILDCEKGVILYSANYFTNWNQFTIQLSAKERQERLKKLDFDSQQLLKAIYAKDPSLANGIYLDYNLNWLCKGCPYLNGCQSLRVTDLKKINKEK